MAAETGTKRMRKKIFSRSETLALIEQYSAHKDVLQSKFKSSVTNKCKQKAWSEVSDAVNAVSSIGRTIAEIKGKWSKLASDARIQLRARKHPPTGNVRAEEMPDLDLMAEIFADSFLIEGIVDGGIDTGEPQGEHDHEGTRSISPTEIAEAVINVTVGEDGNFELARQPSCDDTEIPDLAVEKIPGRHKSQAKGPCTNKSPLPTNNSVRRRSQVSRCDELYEKYKKVAIEVKELKKEKLKMEIAKMKADSSSAY